MQSWPYLVYLFFTKRKLIFTLLILSICGFLGFYASKIKLEEDITRFVPKDKNTANINSILQNLKSKDKLVLHFYSDKEDKIDKLIEAADAVYDSVVHQLPASAYTGITYKVSDNTMQGVYDIFYRNLPFYLNETDYVRLSGLIKKDSIENHAVFFKALLQRQQDLGYSVGSGSLLIFLQ